MDDTLRHHHAAGWGGHLPSHSMPTGLVTWKHEKSLLGIMPTCSLPVCAKECPHTVYVSLYISGNHHILQLTAVSQLGSAFVRTNIIFVW
jgi:hypothetical protein